MFHIGPVPYKLCYLVLISSFFIWVYAHGSLNITEVYWKQDWKNKQIVYFIILAWGIAMFSIFGNMWFNLFLDKFLYKDTFRQAMIYLLVPMGLIYGSKQKHLNLNFMAYLIPIYYILNIIVMFYYKELDWLSDFYFLADEKSNFHITNDGIFLGTCDNANLTSLTMNMMYIMIVIGIKHGFFTYRSIILKSLLIIFIFTLHILTESKNQLFGAILITMYLIYISRKSVKVDFKLVSKVLTVNILLISVVYGIYAMDNPTLKRYAFYGVQGLKTMGRHFSLSWNDRLDNFLRPVSRLPEGREKFLFSPMYGSGVDGSPDTYANAKLHNDWMDTVVTSGIIGFAMFILMIKKSIQIGGLVMAVPLIFPGMTNSFIRAPQAFILYFIIIGFIISSKENG